MSSATYWNVCICYFLQCHWRLLYSPSKPERTPRRGRSQLPTTHLLRTELCPVLDHWNMCTLAYLHRAGYGPQHHYIAAAAETETNRPPLKPRYIMASPHVVPIICLLSKIQYLTCRDKLAQLKQRRECWVCGRWKVDKSDDLTSQGLRCTGGQADIRAWQWHTSTEYDFMVVLAYPTIWKNLRYIWICAGAELRTRFRKPCAIAKLLYLAFAVNYVRTR
jgi:hypothetical protein